VGSGATTLTLYTRGATRLSFAAMNDLTLPVLRALSEGEFRSGEALARTFGVSRGTIHNALKDLDQLGVNVVGSRGLGYRLEDAPTWLDAERIDAAAGAAAALFSLRLEACCDSTSTTLQRLAREGAPSGTVVAAELQTRGRGRRNRVWESGLGSALTFSLLWRFDRGVGALSGLSLAVGVALSRAMVRLGGPEAMLKWPNDLVFQGRKIGGTLIEVEGDALGPSAVIIGIGINVRLTSHLQERIDQPAADLVDAGIATTDRNVVLGGILRELATALPAFELGGFAPFRLEWEAHHAHQNRRVTLILPDGGREEGIARGADDDGALLLAQGGATRRWFAGEVSLRA
jgi:BirA family biotin operon repressor/biotin-[acetyl-CoA-carboxylase] ligase